MSDSQLLDKTRYLVRCFRHTQGKDFENYVILGIWHRLRMANLPFDLQPITQQCVRRSSGRYALLDLYFPAIQFAVECDEAYHSRNKEKDALREADIFRAFKNISADEAMKSPGSISDERACAAELVDNQNLLMARVDASCSYKKIDEQLDVVVSKIKDRIRLFENPMWDCRSAEVIVREKRRISVDMRLTFRTMLSVLEGLNVTKRDGSPYKDWRKGGFELRNVRYTALWFPHLSYCAGGWSNVLGENGAVIIESRENSRGAPDHKTRDESRRYWRKLGRLYKEGHPYKRVVFAHANNDLGDSGYRFMGVYILEDVVWASCGGDPVELRWRRSALSFDCITDVP